MSVTLNFPFTTPTNYTYDSDDIDIDGGDVRLKLQQTDIDFSEDFADDTGFTYDSDKAEFSGGQVQQKLQKPTNSLLYAKWNTDENADYAYGSITGTLNGAAAISGGKLVCAGEAIGHLDFSNSNQGDGNQGTAKFKWTPKFSGAPTTEKIIYWNGNIANYNGAILLLLSGASLYFYIYNSVGSVVLTKSIAFTSVADTPYEVAIAWDFTGAEDSNLFIDGVLKDGGNIIDTRGTTSIHRLGNDGTGTKLADHEYDDLVIYDSVVYTANYTPGYTLPYPYPTTSVILPEMEHVGDGTIKLFNSFTITESGSPRYVLQIGRSGDYLYWDGATWAVSDGTYSQANDATTFNTNCGSLAVSGENYGQFKIIFPDSNTQSSVSLLTANMNVDIYPTTNPAIVFNATFRLDCMDSFTETATKTGGEVKYILKKDDTWYYWSGAAWVESDGTYSQANTAVEIETNKASFVSQSTLAQIKMFLHSDDGASTPEVDNVQVLYCYAGETPDTVSTCLVWGYQKDNQGTVDTTTFTVKPSADIIQYKNYTTIRLNEITVTPAAAGYWEVSLVETVNMESRDGAAIKYLFDFGDGLIFEKAVPDQTTANYYDL